MSATEPREGLICQSFLDQASACETLGSPLKAGSAVADRILNWRGNPAGRADALPLRLAGSLHALVLSGENKELAACYPPHVVSDDRLWGPARMRRPSTRRLFRTGSIGHRRPTKCNARPP